jgi:hypothetical protein
MVNRNKINIVNAKITDIIPANQALLINVSYPLTVSGPNMETVTSAASTTKFTYIDANNFSYEFEEESSGTDTISSEYTVDFYTRIVDPAGLTGLYSNGTVIFENILNLGAASILAKCKREKEMTKIKKEFGEEVGSGYTSDPSTIRYLSKFALKYKDEGIFRKSWVTWKKAFDLLKQEKLNF